MSWAGLLDPLRTISGAAAYSRTGNTTSSWPRLLKLSGDPEARPWQPFGKAEGGAPEGPVLGLKLAPE